MVATVNRDLADAEGPSRPGKLRSVLLAVIAVAALVVAGGLGYIAGHRQHSLPGVASVDAGFAWDMSVHHQQAVTMAAYTRDHTSDPVIKTLAYDIETSQLSQVGQFAGWLDAWGLPPESAQPQMSWMTGGMPGMGADGLMPGMATVAEVNKLETLSGKALDVNFLQLMLRHHQGGLPMAQDAATHAGLASVRNVADKIVAAQSSEIVTMQRLLRERGALALPAPA